MNGEYREFTCLIMSKTLIEKVDVMAINALSNDLSRVVSIGVRYCDALMIAEARYYKSP